MNVLYKKQQNCLVDRASKSCGNNPGSLPEGAKILEKINGKPRPHLPPPQIKDGKWRVFAIRAASSLICGGWGFAVQFYFAQDCRYSECDNVTISRHKMILLLKFACNTDLGLKNWFHD